MQWKNEFCAKIMFEIKCVKKEMYYRRQAWVLKKMCSFVVDSKAYKSVSTQNSGEKSITSHKTSKGSQISKKLCNLDFFKKRNCIHAIF